MDAHKRALIEQWYTQSELDWIELLSPEDKQFIEDVIVLDRCYNKHTTDTNEEWSEWYELLTPEEAALVDEWVERDTKIIDQLIKRNIELEKEYGWSL